MKICSLITSIDELNNLKNYIDTVCIPTNYSISLTKISNDKILDIVNKSKELNKEIILKIDMLPTDNDIKEIISFLDIISLADITLLISDLGLFYVLKDKYKIIYSNSVLVTNRDNFNFYINNGFTHVIPSLEIKFDDVLTFNTNNIFFKAFGYHQMAHSKRLLINTYFNFKDIKTNDIDFKGYIREEIRNEFYNIYQDKKGLVIYRSNPVSYLEKMNDLKTFSYIYLESQFIDFQIYKEVVKTYYDLSKSTISLSEALKKMDNLDIKYENTFIDNSTIYLKESFK